MQSVDLGLSSTLCADLCFLPRSNTDLTSWLILSRFRRARLAALHFILASAFARIQLTENPTPWAQAILVRTATSVASRTRGFLLLWPVAAERRLPTHFEPNFSGGVWPYFTWSSTQKKILTFCPFISGRLFYLFFAFLILNYRFNTQRIFICLLSPLPLCCCHYRYNRTIGLLRVLLSCLFFQNSVKLSTSFFILFFHWYH